MHVRAYDGPLTREHFNATCAPPAGTRRWEPHSGYRLLGHRDRTRLVEGRVYVVRNSTFGATWSRIERRTISIAGRAITSLIHTQGLGDLYRIYVTAQHDGLDFNLA